MRVLIILLFLSSCITEQKAIRLTGRIAETQPKVLATYCDTTFPITARTDSSGYKKSMREIDSLRNIIALDWILSMEEREELLEELAATKMTAKCDSAGQEINCDSLAEPLYRMVAVERRRGDRLEESNKKLIEAARNVKPIRDTILNKAALQVVQLANKALSESNNILSARVTELKTSNKVKFWIIVAFASLSVMLGWVRLRKLLPKIKL